MPMSDLLPLLIMLLYLTGVIIFATGYGYTTFSKTIPKATILSLFWPVFLVSNGRYRRNFRRAVKRNSDPW